MVQAFPRARYSCLLSIDAAGDGWMLGSVSGHSQTRIALSTDLALPERAVVDF